MTALRRVEVLEPPVAAVLPDYQLRFDVPGAPLFEPSAASVKPFEGDHVHGVLYTLSAADFAKVGATEGVPFGYRWSRCKVVPYIGNEDAAGREALTRARDLAVTAFTLIATNRSPGDDIPPSKSYLELIQRGAKEFKMDESYQAKLQDVPIARNLLVPKGLAGITLQLSELGNMRPFG
eukprot:CAMPEP_0194037724 /NCGR_PEP_ID=MMETSP0009_2-20130614/10050_1 /TAXON_ID=210454 /ORGANISM="Grammatophora oceanica, Strain CCMP 410" /LENGTH=178 /DNA_ID=CAMNT_0038679987 /DNA_START=223 /DNA_END=759 /DNA_ORIENTATION=+